MLRTYSSEQLGSIIKKCDRLKNRHLTDKKLCRFAKDSSKCYDYLYELSNFNFQKYENDWLICMITLFSRFSEWIRRCSWGRCCSCCGSRPRSCIWLALLRQCWMARAFPSFIPNKLPIGFQLRCWREGRVEHRACNYRRSRCLMEGFPWLLIRAISVWRVRTAGKVLVCRYCRQFFWGALMVFCW